MKKVILLSLLLLALAGQALADGAAGVPTRYIEPGDNYPYYGCYLWDSAGPHNLTNTTVVFYMKNLSTGQLAVNGKPAVVTDADNGIVEYRWAAPDTNTPGSYSLMFKATTNDGKVYSWPTGFTAKLVIDNFW